MLYGKQELLESLDFRSYCLRPTTRRTGRDGHAKSRRIVGGRRLSTSWLRLRGAHAESALRNIFETLHARGAELTERIMGRASHNLPGVTLYGVAARSAPHAYRCVHPQGPPRLRSPLPGRARNLCSHGDFYAATVTERLGFLRRLVARGALATQLRMRSSGW